MHGAAASTPCALGRDLRHERDARGATAALAYGDLEADWETLAATGLGVDLTPRTQVLKVSEPNARAGGVKVADVAALLDKLKNEAKVI